MGFDLLLDIFAPFHHDIYESWILSLKNRVIIQFLVVKIKIFPRLFQFTYSPNKYFNNLFQVSSFRELFQLRMYFDICFSKIRFKKLLT